MRFSPRRHAFTLLEVMVTLLIVAIVAGAALFSYQGYARKARRADAVHDLLALQLAEENYRSHNAQYGTLAQVWGGVTTSTGGYYTLAVTNVTATGYTLGATAQGAQTSDSENGTSCATLALTVSGGTETRSPPECWD